MKSWVAISPDLNITHMFRDTINVCNLNDLSFSGDIFIWASNHDHDNSHIKCRLDRFLATQEWISLFPNHSNTNLIKFGSDYNPLLLEFSKFNHDRSNFHKVQRFEQIWFINEGHNRVVQQAWANSQIPIAQHPNGDMRLLVISIKELDPLRKFFRLFTKLVTNKA